MINREDLKRKIQQHVKIRELASSNKPKSMPSMPQMVQNVGHSVVKNVRSVASGNSLKISEEDKNSRLDICKSCEFFESVKQRCLKCGCFLSVKTYLKAEKCPINKW